MTKEESLQIAAQCWCAPETSMIEMDSRLAIAFSKRLMEASKVAGTTVRSVGEEEIDKLAIKHATKVCIQMRELKEIGRVPVVDPDMRDSFVAGFHAAQSLNAVADLKSRWPSEELTIEWSHENSAKHYNGSIHAAYTGAIRDFYSWLKERLFPEEG